MGRSQLHRTPVILLMFLLPLITSCVPLKDTVSNRADDPSQSPFPKDFLFGTASSSYQYEGAYLSDGKGLSNWDVFSHEPWHMEDGSNGDVAVDHYHRYLEDIGIMASIGVNAYRFSLSWARILPRGRFGEINLKGIDFYNRLIDEMLSKGIQPFVTLTHYDSPRELEDRYRMWLSRESIKDFAYYADICFKNFGDRVKYWTTFNEPNYQSINGYKTGIHPPGRCSKLFGNCTYGDSEIEPFTAAHNVILAHAAAVNIYRTKYQKEQGGIIGIVMHAFWYVPFSNSTSDILAAQRAQAFFLDWFLEPIIHGRYPREMEEIVGPSLTRFSSAESFWIRTNGLDFIGINHYSSFFIKDCLHSVCENKASATKAEGFLEKTGWRYGIPIGDPTTVDWQYVYPEGMERIVNYVKERYQNTPMFLTENGFGEVLPNCTLDNMEECVNDYRRVNYLSDYTKHLMKAIRGGADVRGYFVWSLLDNFEWAYGYTVRFGLCHVDYDTLQRIPRLSATWYKKFIAKYKSYPILADA